MSSLVVVWCHLFRLDKTLGVGQSIINVARWWCRIYTVAIQCVSLSVLCVLVLPLSNGASSKVSSLFSWMIVGSGSMWLGGVAFTLLRLFSLLLVPAHSAQPPVGQTSGQEG